MLLPKYLSVIVEPCGTYYILISIAIVQNIINAYRLRDIELLL